MRTSHLFWALLALASASGAAAAPQDPPIPGGQTGRLRLEITQAGPTPRSLVLDLNVVSEPTGPINKLAEEGHTAGQKAAWDHRNSVLTQNAPDQDEHTRVWTAFAAACDPEPNGPACAKAKEGVHAFQARLEAANARAEAELAAGPSIDVDNHRFQRWAGDLDRGCGTATLRVGGGTAGQTHSAGQGATAESLDLCLTEMVLDRRTGRAFARFNPLVQAAPGGGAAFDLSAMQRSAPNVKVEPGGYIGSPPHALLRELQIAGSLDAFTAERRLPPRTGAPLDVRLEFRRAD